MDESTRMKETIDLRAYGQLLWRRKWVAIIPMLVASLVGYVITMPRFMRPVYECKATLMVEYPRAMTKELAGLVANPSMDERLGRLESQIQSNEFLTALITNTNMRDDPWVKDWAKKNQRRYPDMTEAELVDLWLMRYLRQSIRMEQAQRVSTNTIEVGVADFYPERARNLVQSITQGVIEASRSAQLRLTQGTEDFSSSQLTEYRTRLADAEHRLEDFQQAQAAKRIRPTVLTEAILPRAEQLRSEARADLGRQQEELTTAAGQLRGLGIDPGRVDALLGRDVGATALAEGRSLELAFVRQSLIEITTPGVASQATALQLARTASDVVLELDSSLAQLSGGNAAARPLVDEYVRTKLRSEFARARVANFDDEFHAYSDRVVSAPEADLELRRLQQQVDQARSVFNALNTQVTSTQLTAAYESSQIGERISVLEPPQRPLKPVKPKRMAIVVMSVLLGLALGVLGAFILEQHDQSFRDVRDLEEALGIKVVGTVPNIPELKTKGRDSKMLGFTEFLDDSPAYREMRRTALALLRGAEGGPSTLLLTSARSEEGKSTAATCLSRAIAKELPRERVLLVDLDFRKPSLARYLGLSLDAPDMAAVIRERRWIEAAARSSVLPNLSIIPVQGGSHLSTEGITEDAFLWLLPELKRHADRVIIDCPPNLPVPDALIMGPHVDAVLLVVKAGDTPRETARRALELQRQFGDNVAGALMNNVAEVLPYYYHYRHYGDGYRARG
ncbi:MAG: GNVR domain-containing protein [Candidatus Eisenbacteria bacterium]